jgi:sterol desaturase/sphingolipid hydroxylase (fatty acid hydroxylase superfamily)
MNPPTFGGASAPFLLAGMAVLALLETGIPFRLRGERWRGHLPANLGLTAITFALNFVLGIVAALLLGAAQERGFGLLTNSGLSPAALLVIAIVALDLSTYLAHRAMHLVPMLWRAHRVHHADPLVDVTTSYRQHPVETSFRLAAILLPALLLGLPFASIVVYRTISASNALLEHANIRLWQALDGALSTVFVTPNMHKVHHSRLAAETDTNFGNIFSLFDRAFRTFTPSVRALDVEYGLEGHDGRDAQRLVTLMRLPFRKSP